MWDQLREGFIGDPHTEAIQFGVFVFIILATLTVYLVATHNKE